MTTYQIHPAVGVARVGDSPDSFYLAPHSIGGAPFECTTTGEPVLDDGVPVSVTSFKDSAGRVRRQAARFTVFATGDDGTVRPVTLQDGDVESITWTVHLANKKACWYNFTELEGDTMLGPDNSYQARNVPLRNPDATDRQKLIIDPGPRTVAPGQPTAAFSRDTIPPDYPYGSFPPEGLQPYPIDQLGELIEDPSGRLLVLGGFGNAGGIDPITSFGGASSWFDDISDGPVTATVQFTDGSSTVLTAWAVVGSPKFAPELVNIATLDDVMLDTAVRYLGLAPDLYDPATWPATYGWNPGYVANFTRDIEPILRRPVDYIWVANVPSMVDFATPGFDPTDTSDAAAADRAGYVGYFRVPGGVFDDTPPELSPDHHRLMSDNGVPLMPLNSGTNSVSNTIVDKFMSLTPTQYYLLYQWGRGLFSNDPPPPWSGVDALDHASVGNAVGHPMCPGIEVTWSTRNPALYESPYRIAHRHGEAWYAEYGLDPSEDETAGGGCEPGDLTKRMAIPWQADFFECSVQWINFTNPDVNKEGGIPKPPTYFAYWWPPQSPMYVISGYMAQEEQAAAGVDAGVQVYYPRGINSFAQMITGWKYMGFIVNTNTGPDRDRYRNFVERERNHDRFVAASVAVGDASNVLNATDQYFQPAWFLKAGP